MTRNTKTLKRSDKIFPALGNKETALISLILMNGGKISETKLKRIYLEKFTYWEMQRTEKKLSEKGLLLKKGDKKNGEELIYEVPKKYVGILAKPFLSKALRSSKENIEPVPTSCCGEFSILRYLWRMDSAFELDLLSSKSRKKMRRMSEKKVEESLEIERESARFLIFLLRSISTSKFFTGNARKKWSDMLVSPHSVVRDIFNIAYYTLREKGELGGEDVGRDNIDFFFEELAALKTGKWYSLEDYVSSARGTLFSCNQPFRWIHFDEESMWCMLSKKIEMLGVVETALHKDGEKFFRLTTLGSYCLGRTSERKLMKDMSVRMGKFMVHPNFEVTVVSREINPKHLLELAMFSQPVKLDTVSVFRITKDTVKEGMNLGLTTDEMNSFLNENSKGRVPQNVAYSIKDWGE